MTLPYDGASILQVCCIPQSLRTLRQCLINNSDLRGNPVPHALTKFPMQKRKLGYCVIQPKLSLHCGCNYYRHSSLSNRQVAMKRTRLSHSMPRLHQYKPGRAKSIGVGQLATK
jgi:hypothetical protein